MKANVKHTQKTIAAILAVLLAVALLALQADYAIADDELPNTPALTLGTTPEEEQVFEGEEATLDEGLSEDVIDPLAANASGTWKRLWGKTALDTMEAIVKDGFSKSNYVIVATNAGYWDALSASGLAGIYSCPIILTNPSALSAQASSQIKRLGAKNAIIVGGTAAVSTKVEKQIKTLGCKTVRLGGKTAIETSTVIYKHGKGKWGSGSVITTAGGYWDALSIAPYAYKAKAPVLLVPKDSNTLPSSVSQALKSGLNGKSYFSRVIIPGGTAAVSSGIEKQARGMCSSLVRLAGTNAYDTSLKVANWCVTQGMSAKTCGVATGGGYWDALCAGPFCGSKNIPLILAEEGYGTCIDGFVAKHTAMRGWIFGGTAALSTNVERRLKAVSGYPTTIPYETELIEFLSAFSLNGGMYAPNGFKWNVYTTYIDTPLYLEYDSSKAANSTKNGSVLHLILIDDLYSMLNKTIGTNISTSNNDYGYEGSTPDPLRKFANPQYGTGMTSGIGPAGTSRYAYRIYDASAVDRVVKNIFNIDTNGLAALRSKASVEMRYGYPDGFYYFGGKYYANWNGSTGGPVSPYYVSKLSIRSWSYGNGFYYVEWDGMNIEGTKYLGVFTAKLSLKDIGGKTYWTIYTNEKK